jgi:predicted dehydrogenase
MIGAGDVTEVKSGPALQKAAGSSLVAVMRRDRAKAEDYARRHGIARVHTSVDALIDDPGVDAVYVATPPSSHRELALRAAAARKPCLVEKPMAMTHAECLEMVEAFDRAGVPLWVAYYRRALPRFVKVRELLATGAIGQVTSVHVEVHAVLPSHAADIGWRVDPAIAGAGLFFDLASHCFDLLDFLIGPITAVSGSAINSGGVYPAEDVTAAAFALGTSVAGTGLWNFHASEKSDRLRITGSRGELSSPIFSDTDVTVARPEGSTTYSDPNPPHVHQPLVQTIVDELAGRGRCESTGASGARASWVMDQCVREYYAKTKRAE